MAGESDVLFKILLLHIALPAALTLRISGFMRKKVRLDPHRADNGRHILHANRRVGRECRR